MDNNFDLNIDLEQLKRADRYIKDMVTDAKSLQESFKTLSTALASHGLGDALGTLESRIKAINSTKVAFNFDKSTIEKAYSALDSITVLMRNMAAVNGEPIQFFDTKALSTTTRSVLEIDKEIGNVERSIRKLKKAWDDSQKNAQKVDMKLFKPTTEFEPPINPKTNKAFSSSSKAYKAEREAYQKRVEEERALWEAEQRRLAETARISIENQHRVQRERLKNLQEEKRVAMQTMSERADAAMKLAQNEKKANETAIKQGQAEYAKTLAEMQKRAKEISSLGGDKNSASASTQIKGLEERFMALNEKRKQMEAQLGTYITQIAEKYNADILSIEAKRILERKRQEDAASRKNKKDNETAISKGQAEYAKVVSEMRMRQQELSALKNNPNSSSASSQIKGLEERFVALNERRIQLETAYGSHVTRIAEKYNADILNIEAKRILEKQRQEDAARQKAKREDEAAIKKGQAEYAKTLTEMQKRLREIASLKSKNKDDALNPQIKGLEQRFMELNNKRKQMEVEYGSFVTHIAEKYNADILKIEAKRIMEKKRQQDIAWQKDLQTPMGALMQAGEAKTIQEMKAAQKNLLIARDNTDVNDTSTIKKLNDEYMRLRATINGTTKAERNEYARLIRELDKVSEARARLQKTMSYKQGDTSAIQANSDLIKREQDLQNRIAEIRRNAKNKLASEDNKFAAEKAAKELADTERLEQQKLQIAMKKLRQRIATRNFTPEHINRSIASVSNATNVAQEEEAIKKLTKARQHLNTSTEAGKRALADINKAIAEHTHKIKMTTDASYREAQEKKKRNTYSGAMQYAKEAKTIGDQIKAIEHLKQARRTLDTKNDDKWKSKLKSINKELDRLQRNVNKVEGTMKKTTSTVDQLAKRFAMLFSVNSIYNYVKKIAEVRGEFELQQKALQSIIGSQDEANRIWDKTVALAVKSPFRVKELVTYTKQLAAYRVESSKLYDTTKMLADISAGLGVDMNRLILAYGQVKAANYLRGTELRQFSEAGVNVLKELADYFTEVEGRAVTVAEVFERVSNRGVTFEHLHTVLSKLTSEGGMFFEMQEKQAETLHGMIMNLSDSFDIMMDDIGKSNEGALKFIVKTTKAIVDNWEKFSFLLPIITGALTLVVGRLTAAAVATLGIAQAFKSIGWGGWVTIILSIVAAVYEWYTATNKLRRELEQVDREVTKTLYESYTLYRKLAKESTDLTKTEEERFKAQEKIKQQFKDILPDEYLQIQYLQKMADNYKAVEDAMVSYYTEKAKQQKREKIENKYNADIETDIKDATDWFNRAMDRVVEGAKGANKTDIKRGAEALSAVFPAMLSMVIEDIKSGEIGIDQIGEELNKRLMSYLGDDKLYKEIFSVDFKHVNGALEAEQKGNDFWKSFNVALLTNNLNELRRSLQEYSEEMNRIQGLPSSSWANLQATDAFKAEKEEIEGVIAAYDELTRLYTEREMASFKGDSAGVKRYDSTIKQQMTQYEAQFKSYFKNLKEFQNKLDENEGGTWGIIETGREYAEEFFRTIAKEFGKATVIPTDARKDLVNAAKDITINEKEKLFGKADVKKLGQNYISGIKEVMGAIERSGIDVNELVQRRLMPAPDETASTIRTRFKEAYESVSSEIKQLENSLAVVSDKDSSFEIMQQKKSLEHLKQLQSLYRTIAQIYGGDTTKKNDKNDATSYFERMARAIHDTHKDFLQFNDDMDKSAARMQAYKNQRDEFAAAANAAGVTLSLDQFSNLDTEAGVVEGLREILRLIPSDAHKAEISIQKLIGAFMGESETKRLQENLETIKTNIEDLFSKYELSIELQDMNVNPAVMQSLFNVDYIDVNGLRDKVLEAFNISYRGTDESTIDFAKSLGLSENKVKLIGESLKKITDMEYSELQKRFKNYIKYIRGAEDEMMKLQLDLVRKLSDVDKTFVLTKPKAEEFGLTDTQYREYKNLEAINEETLRGIGLSDEKIKKVLEYNKVISQQAELVKRGMREESNEAMQRVKLKNFQESSYFRSMSEDLSKFKTKALNRLAANLITLRESLDKLDSKELDNIKQTLEQIDKIKSERSLFGMKDDYGKKLKEIKKETFTISTMSSDGETWTEKEIKGIDAVILKLDDLRQKKAEAQDNMANAAAIKEEQQLLLKNNTLRDAERNAILNIIKSEDERIQQGRENISTWDDEINRLEIMVENYKRYPEMVKQSQNNVQKWADETKEMLGITQELLDVLGLAEDSQARIWVEASMGIVDCISATTQLILQFQAMEVAANSALGVIGYIAMALKALVQVFATIFGNGDDDRRKQIQALQLEVDNLERSFNKLEKQIEETLGVEDITTSTEMAISKLEEQNKKLEEMIALERDNKDTNAKDIQNYNNQIEDNLERIEELEAERIKELGGIGDAEGVKDAAQEFTDAWLNAFLETGSGLSGLEDKFKEFAKNIVRQQLMHRMVENLIKPITTKIDSIIGKDGIVEDYEWQELLQEVEEQLPHMDKVMQSFVDQLGGLEELATTTKLDGLQKGVENITEDTAQELVAYMNSIRTLVAERDEKVDSWFESLDKSLFSPMYEELSRTAEYLSDIKRLVSSVIYTGGHTLGGYGIKVFI